MILQAGDSGRARLLGAMVLALLCWQPLVAQEGWKSTFSGDANGMIAVGQSSSNSVGRDKASQTLSETGARTASHVNFEAAHDFAGLRLGLGVEVSRTVNSGWNVTNDGFVWLHLLAPWGVSKELVDLNLAVGFLAGWANDAMLSASTLTDVLADSVLADVLGGYMLADVRVDSKAAGQSWTAGQASYTKELDWGSVARLDVKLFQVALLRTLLFIGDWDHYYNAADLSAAVVVDELQLAPGHKLGFSAGLAADVLRNIAYTYVLKYQPAVPAAGANTLAKPERDDNKMVETFSTITVALKYEAALPADLVLKVNGGLGLNNLLAWENEQAETTGPYAGKKLRSNQPFMGWYSGASFGHKLLSLGVEAAGRTAIKAGLGEVELARAMLVKNMVLELSSSIDAAKLDLFVRGVLDFTYDDYLLRVLEFGASYHVIKSAEANFWLKLGYGLVLADPKNGHNYEYNTGLMKEGEPGLYLKVGGNFKKTL